MVNVIVVVQIYPQTPHFIHIQGAHGQGKTGKMAKKNSLQGKHREFENQ